MSRNHDKLFELNTFQKIFLLSNYLKESKPQKNWFANKFNECMSNIRNDVDFITKERRLEHLKRKYKGNSFSNKKNTIFLDIKKLNKILNLNMPVLITSNYKRYYNNDLISCAGLFTLCMIVLAIILPAFIVLYCRGK